MPTRRAEAQEATYREDDDLPEGWVWARLGSVCDLNPPKPKQAALSPEAPVTFVPMPAVDAEAGAITRPQDRPFSEVRKGFTAFADGDVIMAKITPCMENGKAAIAHGLANGLGFGSTEFHVLRPIETIAAEWVYYFIRQQSFRKHAESEMTGSVGQKRVPADFLSESEIPLPPLPEQRRILEQVEALLARVNAARTRLARAPALLKAFRQAILTAAFSGKLTEEWRESETSLEPASELLNRIRTTRLGKASTDLEKYRISESFDIEAVDLKGLDLPEVWSLSTIGAIGTVSNGSTPSRPQGSYWGGSISWVSSGEVRNNIIRETREKITRKGFENSSVRLLPPGTVLLAMIGEGKTRGQSAILEIEATINQNSAAVVIDHGLISSRYLWFWFRYQYEATREAGGGTGPQALNCRRVRELPFALAPQKEQHEIVRRVEALFALADAIEAKVAAAQNRADALTQAILAKAFRGELVPTEAALARAQGRPYESAGEELLRLGRERTSGSKVTPTRRGRNQSQ